MNDDTAPKPDPADWPWKKRGDPPDPDTRDPGDERFGLGICVRGTCLEPCGPNGGCIR